MAVDGAARHADDAGDLLDGVLAGVVQALGQGRLVLAQVAAETATDPGRAQAVASVCPDQLVLQMASPVAPGHATQGPVHATQG